MAYIYITCLLGALWLGLIAIGLWKIAPGLKAIITRRATLRNFRFRVTSSAQPGWKTHPPT